MAEPHSEPTGNAAKRLLDDYLHRVNRGEQVDRDQFIAEHPESADQLRAYFAGRDAAGGEVGGSEVDGAAAKSNPASPVQATLPPESGGPVTHSQSLFTSETTGYPSKPILGGLDTSGSPAEPLGIDQVASFLNSSGLLSPEKVNDLLSRASQEGNSADAGQVLDELRSSGRLTQFQCDAIRRGQGLQLILGNYVLMDRLGRGGMGQVYRAWHRKMDRVVALKTLRPETMNSAKAVERFHREVKTAARLAHPNIVMAHDSDESGGVHFLVMEHVGGSDLADHIRQHGPARVAQAAVWILQAARGLAHAHEHGIIHRDIKPGNLLLGSDGTVKVLDMGLARLEERLGEEAAVEALTETGDVLGTFDYMAPEQAEDTAHADARADIYSLGCTLFYLLTGRAVYGGHTAVKKILAHREAPVPSLTEVRRDVPEQIDDLFRRMVAKDPADRPASMGEVIAELEPFVVAASTAKDATQTFPGAPPGTDRSGPAREEAGVAAPSTSSRRRRAVIALAVVLVVALPVFAGVFVFRMQTPEGTLVVEVSQPGATVEVVDLAGTVKVTDTSGEGPLVLSVQPGEHRVRVIKDGFEFFAQDVTIRRRGEHTVRAVLEPKRDTKPSDPAAPVRESTIPPWSLPPDAPTPAIAPFDADQARRHQEEWAEYLDVPVELTNSIGMKFVFIPPGEFMMGSSEDEIEQLLKEAKSRQERQWYIDRLPSEAPRHRVRITRPLYLGVYEVTQAQYKQVREDNPSALSSEGKEAAKVAGLDTSHHPVEMVSWSDAKAFCEKLSAMPEEQAAGRVYVLPTEAQWEYASRAGTTTKWSFGNDEGALGNYAWFSANSGGKTHAVGEKKPNAFGLFDMPGNVWEWCADWFGNDYYPTSPVDDPPGSASGSDRVIRGGCWSSMAGGCRSAFRRPGAPGLQYSDLGFRLVLVLAEFEATMARTGIEGPKVPSQPAGVDLPAAEEPPLRADTKAAARATPWSLPPDSPTPAVVPFDADQARRHQEEWGEYLDVPVKFTNSIGMEFVLIPPGEFMMGTPEEEVEAMMEQAKLDKFAQPYIDRLSFESPQHLVRITRAFHVGAHEVTVGQFRAFVEDSDYRMDAENDGGGGVGLDTATGKRERKPEYTWRNPGFAQTDDHPVTNVSWNDAVAFCEWLSSKEGKTYRLPTEAEWEYACLAGTTTSYSFGDDASALDQYAWWGRNSSGSSHPVGRKQPNAWRLYDMHGNVWEWCADWFDGGYYADSPADDPPGPASGTSRVLRGGGFHSLPREVRCASRITFEPVDLSSLLGFRVARTYD